jgi:hypothetical protein
MKTFIIALLFVGVFMIVHGIYEERFEKLKNDVRVKYKFIPRTYYDEMITNDNYTSKFSSALFNGNPQDRANGFPLR